MSARFRHTTFKDAFNQFVEKPISIENQLLRENNNFKFISFYNFIKKKYKKPFKSTDLCHYCEFGKNIIKELKEFLIRNNLVYTYDFSSLNLLSYFSKLHEENFESNLDREITIFLENIRSLESIEFHKSISNRQRKA